MGRRPKMSAIEKRLEEGKDFVINRNEYISLTGIDIPQNPYYTAKKSAVAKLAKEHGFEIQVIPEQLKFVNVEGQ